MDKSPKAKPSLPKVTKSSDGEFLINQSGKKFARYIKELDLYVHIDGEARAEDQCAVACIPYKYCIGWDSTGKCTNWAYSCRVVYGPCPQTA